MRAQSTERVTPVRKQVNGQSMHEMINLVLEDAHELADFITTRVESGPLPDVERLRQRVHNGAVAAGRIQLLNLRGGCPVKAEIVQAEILAGINGALQQMRDLYPAAAWDFAQGQGEITRRERALRLVADGATLREAGERVGVTHQAVAYWRDSAACAP